MGSATVYWVIFLGADSVLLASVNLVYSYSSFKLDLKESMGWDEASLGLVWSMASMGMNLMVHIGQLYDRCGPMSTAALAIACKLLGLAGMGYAVSNKLETPLFFGACFFLDAQGTAAALVIGQSEALKRSPAALVGTALSIAKTAFGLGPLIWQRGYGIFFAPGTESLFFFASLCSAATIILWAVVARFTEPRLTSAKVTKGAGSKPTEEATLLSKLLSYDASVVCGTVSIVTWGTALMWTSNLSNFVVAAGMKGQMTLIQSTFFGCSSAARLLIGPAVDILPLAKELWVFLASAAMVTSSLLMLASGGAWLPAAAALVGLSFGADATLLPMMCGKVSAQHQATLYALAKITGLVCSTVWIRHAGIQAEQHKASGVANCEGSVCYQNTWMFVVGVTVPACCFTSVWALRRTAGRPDAKKE